MFLGVVPEGQEVVSGGGSWGWFLGVAPEGQEVVVFGVVFGYLRLVICKINIKNGI